MSASEQSNPIKMRADQAVPMVVTETTIYREPKIERTRVFRGLRDGLTSLVENVGAWAWEQVQDAFFEEKIEVTDPGHRAEKHFAIIVGTDGYDRVLQAVEVEHKPPCIHHYELVKFASEEEAKIAQTVAGASAIRRGAPTRSLDQQERQDRLAHIRSRLTARDDLAGDDDADITDDALDPDDAETAPMGGDA